MKQHYQKMIQIPFITISTNRFSVILRAVWICLFAAIAVFGAISPVHALIFEDGFESGDLSAWSGNSTNAGDTITASTEQALTGTYSAKAVVDTDAAANQAMVWRNFTGETTVYARIYIYVPSSFSTADYVATMQFLNDWSNIITTTIDDDMTLYMNNNVADELYGYGVGSTLSKNEWHCLEMMAVISPTVGEARLWLDGNLEIEATGKNLGSNTIDKFSAGYYWGAPYDESNTLYIDDAAVDTSPIGPLGEAAPCDEWWDDTYLKRKNITITAGTAQIPSGYSVSVTFDHADMVSEGSAQADGDDVRVAYWNGTTWTELDRAVDPLSSWNDASTQIWFKSQATINASASADNYYIYYDKPSASNPPDDWANVFMVGDDFNDGTLTTGLDAYTNGSATISETGGEAVINGGSANEDAGIIVTDSALPGDRKFTIRHKINHVSGSTDLPSGCCNPEVKLIGISESASQPAVPPSLDNAQRRISVFHRTDTNVDGGQELTSWIFYFKPGHTPVNWDGTQWVDPGNTISWGTLPMDTYFIYDLVSDGTNWYVRVSDANGTVITETDPVPWTSVEDNSNDFWFYWGEGYTAAYWHDTKSDWVHVRKYVDPEPTTSIGGQECYLGYCYRRSITIDGDEVGGSSGYLADFPVLVNLYGDWLNTTTTDPTNGRIENASGYDIVFRGLDATTCNGTPPCTLDHEIEHYDGSATSADVSLHTDDWATGLGPYTVPADSNRLLVFVVGYEDTLSNQPTIDKVEFGAVSMTRAVNRAEGTNPYHNIEIWTLRDDKIPTGPKSFSVTYTGASPNRTPMYAYALFTNVDQMFPIMDTASQSASDDTVTTGTFDVLAGGISISGAINNDVGSFDDNAWGTGWAEETDEGTAGTQATMGTGSTTSAYGSDGTDTATASFLPDNGSGLTITVAASLRPASGRLVAWVRVPKLYAGDGNPGSDSVIYMYYGSACVADDPQNATAVWDSNYAAVWHLAEKDLGLDFDGVDDYVDTGYSTHHTQTTIEAWIYPEGWGGNTMGRVVDKREAGNQVFTLYLYGFSPGKHLRFERVHGLNTGSWKTDDDTLALDTWYHIVVTYDESSTANEPSIYINGQLQNLTQMEIPDGTPLTNTDDYIIGNRGNQERTFDGIINNLRIYSRILTPQEAQDSYLGKPVSSQDLVIEYLMDKDSGDTVSDSSGNGYDGDMTGHAAAWVRSQAHDSTHNSNWQTQAHDSTANNNCGKRSETMAAPVERINGCDPFNSQGIGITDPGGSWEFADGGLDAGTGDFTISAWFLRSAAMIEIDPTIVTKGGGSAASAGYWFQYRKGEDEIYLRVADGSKRFSANSNNAPLGVTADEWHYVTAVFDREPTEDTAYFYLNGDPVGTESSPDIAGNSVSGSNDVWIGTNNFIGNLDEVRISSEVRTADWIKTEFNNQKTSSTFYGLSGEAAVSGYVAPTAPTSPYSNNTSAQSGQINPSDITDPTPAFSAIYNDPDSGDVANKYRVEVNTASDFNGTVMWDSGAGGTYMANTTEGSRCPDIIYAGSTLSSDTIYYWRISFWDDDGIQGTVSAVQNFTTGTISTTTQSWGENSSRDDFNAVTEDTFMDSGSTSHEEGTCTGNAAVRIGYRTDAGSRAMRSLIKFDLSGLQSLISSSSQIVSAALKVNIARKEGNDIDVDAFRVLKSWSQGDQCHDDTDLDANEATWLYQSYSTTWSAGGAGDAGTDRASSADDTTTITGTGWFGWDVTGSVKDMFDDENYDGWVLKSQSESGDNWSAFWSSEDGTAANRPYLEITYNNDPER
jgi:hypothetical protein